MNWEAVSTIAEIVGATGVIVSLLIVAWQIRENTAATRAEAHLSLITLGNDQFHWAREPHFMDLFLRASKDSGSLTEDDIVRLVPFVLGHFNTWHQSFKLFHEGLLTEPDWEAWNRGMTAGAAGGPQRFMWPHVRLFYNPSFRKHVDSMLDADTDA